MPAWALIEELVAKECQEWESWSAIARTPMNTGLCLLFPMALEMALDATDSARIHVNVAA
jgi:hypothetical protein